MEKGNSISVEVVFAGADATLLTRLDLPVGATVEQAVQASGILASVPDFVLSDENVGVFSRKVGLNHVLVNDDRVELYRPLFLTPNEIRLLRAERKKHKKS